MAVIDPEPGRLRLLLDVSRRLCGKRLRRIIESRLGSRVWGTRGARDGERPVPGSLDSCKSPPGTGKRQKFDYDKYGGSGRDGVPIERKLHC